MKENLLARIVVNPDILVGKPIIKGSSIAVTDILDLLAAGMATEEILQKYRQLQKEDVLACLACAREIVADITYCPTFSK